MFKMEMMCTKVSYCYVSSCIKEFTHYLISVISFVVAIPIIQSRASPRKGSRPLLGCGLSEVVSLSRAGLVLTNCMAVHMIDSYNL